MIYTVGSIRGKVSITIVVLAISQKRLDDFNLMLY